MWHPINTIPKDGKDYLVFGSNELKTFADIVHWSDDRDARNSTPMWRCCDEEGDPIFELTDAELRLHITHWTELPE